MNDSNESSEHAGLREPAAEARSRFLEAVSTLRPRLHQFCTRMTGSVFDGEDLVQDTLADAFFKLGGLRDERALAPWLFRIAHNKAIDFVRRVDPAFAPEEDPDMAESPEFELDRRREVSAALSVAITRLPPKERACLVLKDVLGHSLEEIAGIADTSIGGAKAALHRARTKLEQLDRTVEAAELAEDELTLLQTYVACFNAHDWHAAGDLLGADARLELVGRIEGRGSDFIQSTYFVNYQSIPWSWRFEVWRIDGEPMAVMLKEVDGAWRPHAGFRVRWAEGRIVEIRDYIYVPYLYEAAVTQQRVDSI